MDNDLEFIILSSDNKVFKVNEEIINYSQTFKDLLFDQTHEDNLNTVKVDFVESSTLSHIIAFIRYNIKNNDRNFNKRFVENMNLDTLLDTIIASKELDIKELFELTSNRFRTVIKKDPKDIRSLFGLEDDL